MVFSQSGGKCPWRSTYWSQATAAIVEWDDDAPASALASAKPGGVLTFGGHRYQLVLENLDWMEAKTKAEAMGGHLATITSPEENDWMKKIKVSGHVFLGGSRSGKKDVWTWVTGEAFDLKLWGGNGSDGSGDKLSYDPGHKHWDDVKANGSGATNGFLVEWDDDGTAKPTSTAATVASAPGVDSAVTNSLGMKFVPVPITGGPTHGQRVLFSIWATRVQDYQVFANETKRERPNPELGQGATHPAVNVSWDDAQAFCAWLTERERKAGKLGVADSYRLPSDHEWSCAVGIGEQEDPAKLPGEKHQRINGEFPWGSAWPPPTGVGNYAGEEMKAAIVAEKYPGIKSLLASYNDGFVDKSPVGTFPPNRFGLYDMGGNVIQWCEEWYDKSQKIRTLRGASFAHAERGVLLSSRRVSTGASGRSVEFGFRIVLMQGAGSPVGTVAASAPKAEAAPVPAAAAMPAAPSVDPKPQTPEVKPSVPAPADPRLAQLAAGFKARHEADALQPFNTALAALNTSYLANGVARARAAAQAKGSLAEVTALDTEKSLLDQGIGVPDEDPSDAPESLKTLRGTYRTAFAKIRAERDVKGAPLYDLYLKALDVYIAELTKDDKIQQAQEVKTLRDNIAAKASATEPKPAPAAEKAGASATTPAPAELKGSSWRVAATWCLLVKGTVWGKNFGPTFKVEDLPSGRFEITRIHFGDTPAGTMTDATLAHLTGLRELDKFETDAREIVGPGLDVFRTTPKVRELTLRAAQQLNSLLKKRV